MTCTKVKFERNLLRSLLAVVVVMGPSPDRTMDDFGTRPVYSETYALGNHLHKLGDGDPPPRRPRSHWVLPPGAVRPWAVAVEDGASDDPPEEAGAELSIQQASETLSVPAPTIRSWERRYGVPVADRSSGGHRRYRAASGGGGAHRGRVHARRRRADGDQGHR